MKIEDVYELWKRGRRIFVIPGCASQQDYYCAPNCFMGLCIHIGNSTCMSWDIKDDQQLSYMKGFTEGKLDHSPKAFSKSAQHGINIVLEATNQRRDGRYP